MTDYTPTTTQVGNFYEQARKAAYERNNATPPGVVQRFDEFKRWLEQVKAKAWDEGAEAAALDVFDAHEHKKYNPYRNPNA